MFEILSPRMKFSFKNVVIYSLDANKAQKKRTVKNRHINCKKNVSVNFK